MTDLVAQVIALSDEDRLELFEKTLGNITLGECLSLVKHLEETFGVDSKQKAPEFSHHPDDAEEEVEQTEFSAVLTELGDSKIAVIRAVRGAIAGLSLKQAKDKLSPLPATLLEGVSKDAAEKLQSVLKEAGATVEVK